MTESFLHYVWQYQYFDKNDLRNTQGEPLTIFKTGLPNHNAGPDFSNARIRIDSIEWMGSIEVHVNASEWLQHKHQHDKAYDTVVLHVVWKNDKPIQRSDGTAMPTLELKNRVSETLLQSYKKLVNHPDPIPCSHSLAAVPFIIKTSALERALTQRLEAKAAIILDILKKKNNDWEETTYQLLGKNFGFKVNSDPFERVTQAISYKILLKHADKPYQVEALLFGIAGLLDKKTDEYSKLLDKEYAFLKTKYLLQEKQLHKSHWRFLRLRPANFPTIRIAQFASLIGSQRHLFSAIIAAESIQGLRQLFDITQSSYWQEHYQLCKPSKGIIHGLGTVAIETIIINTVAPLLVAYSQYKDEPLWTERALGFLSKLSSEKNSIMRQWLSVGWKANTAFDSQGMIELKNNYCAKRQCLQCAIGASLVRPV